MAAAQELAASSSEPTDGALVLFTRDLRVRDQPALAAAARDARRVLPAFVFDERLLASGCGAPNRVSFLLDCLRDLDESLRERGTRLLVCRGEVVEQALRLAKRFKLSAIYMSADVTPYARERERSLRKACGRERIALRTFPGITIVPAGELTPTGGNHYRVFTPYWRVWSAQELRAPLRAPRHISAPTGLSSKPLPTLRSLTGEAPGRAVRAGGERAARALTERWLRSGLARYDATRDTLALAAGTSQLSAHLHFGCVSAATLLARTDGHEGGEDFARQLCWRDFHHQVLAANPDMPHADYRPRRMRWREDPQAAQAWRVGMTGVPLVDAGMRQLAREGFMHNRARMVVASFLTKTLGLHWRIGAAHFASLLTDADVANNVGNWQWVAGTGNDTRPNRVLNPLRQAARFDPRGEYVRRYVPELAELDDRHIHEPWRLPPRARRALGYPAPLVQPGALSSARTSR